jgi:hypothetical protein
MPKPHLNDVFPANIVRFRFLHYLLSVVLLILSNGIKAQQAIVCPCGVVVFAPAICPCATYYRDADGDGFGNPNVPFSGLLNTIPAGYVVNNTDCNDSDNKTYPGAPELCDGKDNDCNGLVEDGVIFSTWYYDNDGDGYGNPNNSAQFSCDVPFKYVRNNLDCDDLNSFIHGALYYRDFDGDGYGDPNVTQLACTQPAGYASNDDDCNDQNNSINMLTWVKDADDDGLYVGDLILTCNSPGTGYVLKTTQQPGDCNDNDPSNSMVVYVNKKAAGPVHDGRSWTTAYITLQDALANTNGCTQQIWVAAGIYFPDEGGGKTNNDRDASFSLKNGIAIYGGFAGTETLLAQRNWKLHNTILSGGIKQNDGPGAPPQGLELYHGNSFSVIRNDNIDNTAKLDGFTITGGNRNFKDDESIGGGGMRNSFSSPVVANCIFIGNRSPFGGGMLNYVSSPLVINCQFTSNSADVDAVYSLGTLGGGMMVNHGSPTLINCTFFGNIADEGWSIYVAPQAGTNLSLINCTLYKNQIYAKALVTMINCIAVGGLPLRDNLPDPTTIYGPNFNVTYSIIRPGPDTLTNLGSDPLFVDTLIGNFRLKPGSPAIGAGNDAANSTLTDLDGNSRKIGTIDMGAYEFGSSIPGSCTPISLARDPDILYPDGCGTDGVISVTYPYSSTTVTLTPTDLAFLNLPFAPGSCDIAMVKYKDVIDQALTTPVKTVVIRTYTITDINGNVATATQQIEVTDRTPPTYSGAGSPYLGCNPVESQIEHFLDFLATPLDNCGTPTVVKTDVVTNEGCFYTKTRTHVATDASGNSASTSRTVTWRVDNTKPVFTGNYDDVNLGANPANPSASLGSASATDGCSTTTITSLDGPVVTNGSNISQTRTFTARDGCNNTATISRTVRWTSGSTLPEFTGAYTDVDLGCNPSDPDAALGNATATSECGTPDISHSDGPVVSNGCNRSKTRTFTAFDQCGTVIISRTVRWKVDITPPTLTTGGTMLSLGCNPSASDINAALGTATATDACGNPSVTSVTESIIGFCFRTQTRTFKAIDACGNSSTASRTVFWKETFMTFSPISATVTLGCNPSPEDIDAAFSTATAVGCDIAEITYDDDQSDGNTPCTRKKTRTWKAIDACGSTATISQTITWTEDHASPTFTGTYQNVTLGINPTAEQIAAALGTATADDPCYPPSISFTDGEIISEGCTSSQTRTFTAKDGCGGNTASISRTVTWIADATPPTFNGTYPDINLGCNPANPDGSLGSASATDGCGAVTITQTDGAVISYGCNRSRTRTFTATDGCLNTATTSRTVRWVADDTPPEFTGSYVDINLGCNPAYPEGALGTATATDACGDVTITSIGLGTEYDGCNRSITRRFIAKDQCGNRSTITRTVRWIVELSPPTFTGSYTDINLGCNPVDPSGSLGTATATDVCGAVTITSIDGSVVSNGCNRSITRTFTSTDGCLNTSSTSRTVRWIYDKTSPTLTCAQTGTVTKSTSTDQCSYTVDGAEFNPTASDACSTSSLGWSVSGATTTSGTTTMAGVLLNFGYNTIKWTATDGCNNTSTCSFIVHVNKVTTKTTLVVSTTPATNPVTQQYSDKITCVATVTPANCTGVGPIGGTVTFKIITAQGTVVLGSAPVASDGTATLTDTLLENQFYPGATNLLPSNGPLKPGNKTVTAEYSGTDPDYIVTNPTAPLVVTCEDAEITYNGLSYFGANPTTNQGTITVSAFVLDTNDVNDSPPQARGDIRNATVTFKEGGSAGTVIGSSNIPVGLVNPTNFQEGIVTTSKLYTLTTQDINCGGKIVDVWAGVNNYYCGEFDEVVPVCLSLPGGDFVTGGGWIKMLNSEGSYAGTDDKKMHAAIVFKWNKSNKNLQGNATIVYKRIVNGVQKVYQIKSNSITSMIVNNVNDAGTVVTTGATYRMAQIVAKANFRDLTDPDFPIALFGNLTLTITAWESINTTDGSKDRISVQLVGSGSQGLIFSSNWLSGATQWQQLNSGKMRVRNPSAEIPCTNCAGSGITTKTGEVDKAIEVLPDEDLKVVAMPNPSSTNFRIVVNSNDLKEPLKLIVSDMLGRVIETRITNAGQTVTIGDKYISGTYAVRIMQGRKIRQLTLIKLSD